MDKSVPIPDEHLLAVIAGKRFHHPRILLRDITNGDQVFVRGVLSVSLLQAIERMTVLVLPRLFGRSFLTHEMASPAGFEPATSRIEVSWPIQLAYGEVVEGAGLEPAMSNGF